MSAPVSRHVCAATGLTPATSAPGLGSLLPHLRRGGLRGPHRCHIGTSSCPILHRGALHHLDASHPHICMATADHAHCTLGRIPLPVLARIARRKPRGTLSLVEHDRPGVLWFIGGSYDSKERPGHPCVVSALTTRTLRQGSMTGSVSSGPASLILRRSYDAAVHDATDPTA